MIVNYFRYPSRPISIRSAPTPIGDPSGTVTFYIDFAFITYSKLLDATPRHAQP